METERANRRRRKEKINEEEKEKKERGKKNVDLITACLTSM